MFNTTCFRALYPAYSAFGRLSRQHTLAFVQGLHARLGAQCVYRGVVDDVITRVVAQGRVLNEPYKHMHEGLRRLLAVDLRLT